jgi:Neuraminidase (sialidase)
VFAYEGATTPYAPQHVYVKTSDDEGLTWGERTALSADGQDAGQPRIAATGNGDERLWFMQTSDGGVGLSWNVWYRSSTDGGATWSDPVKISDAAPGTASYITAEGFGEVYGDYGEIAITNTGKTIGVWGEAPSYNGPGGTWFNIQS